jgi:hypothetical protein
MAVGTDPTQVSENNPYQQALAGQVADQTFAGIDPNDPRGSNPSVQAPNDKSTTINNPSVPAGSGIVAQEKALTGDYPIPAQSVADTPEAATKQQTNQQETGQQEAAFAKVLNPKSKGAQPPTEQQDIDQALAPDISELDQLPAQYKSIISQVAPYINGGQNTGNAALNQADAAVAAEVGTSDNKVMAALKGVGQGVKESEGTVPYAAIIQALLGYGKYEETYAGAQPQDQQNWTQSMDEIYKYLSGANASTDGLGSPQSAAQAEATTQGATASDTAGGGNS